MSKSNLLPREAHRRALQSEGFWKIIHDYEGEYGASKWMAAHIGRIYAENKDLERRVRALERKVKV